MATRLSCPACGGNFYPDPDDEQSVVCMMCSRTFKLAELRTGSTHGSQVTPPRVSPGELA